MSKLQPIILHREFESIVKAVETKLLVQLKIANPRTEGINYLYGHPLEIVNTLTGYDQDPTTTLLKYPIVAFFLDSEEDRTNIDIYSSQRVHLAIINQCFNQIGDDVAKQRDENNFIPVLIPIYMELMRQINFRSDLFDGMRGEQSISHRKTNRYYWGRSGLFGNDSNIFNDKVDAIEIENLELRINLNYCPKPETVMGLNKVL